MSKAPDSDNRPQSSCFSSDPTPCPLWTSSTCCESPEAGERKTSVLLLTLRAKLGEVLDLEANLGQGLGAFGGLRFSLSVSAPPLQQSGRS